MAHAPLINAPHRTQNELARGCVIRQNAIKYISFIETFLHNSLYFSSKGVWLQSTASPSKHTRPGPINASCTHMHVRFLSHAGQQTQTRGYGLCAAAHQDTPTSQSSSTMTAWRKLQAYSPLPRRPAHTSHTCTRDFQPGGACGPSGASPSGGGSARARHGQSFSSDTGVGATPGRG